MPWPVYPRTSHVPGGYQGRWSWCASVYGCPALWFKSVSAAPYACLSVTEHLCVLSWLCPSVFCDSMPVYCLSVWDAPSGLRAGGGEGHPPVMNHAAISVTCQPPGQLAQPSMMLWALPPKFHVVAQSRLVALPSLQLWPPCLGGLCVDVASILGLLTAQ